MENKKKFLTRKSANTFRWLVVVGAIIYGFVGWLCIITVKNANLMKVLGVALIAFAVVQIIIVFASKRISKTKFVILSIINVVPLILLLILGDDGLLLSEYSESELCEICPNCGSEITSKQNYCSHCGKSKEQK